MEAVTKNSTEVIPHTIDWTDRVPSTDTILTASATAVNLTTNRADTSVFVSTTGTVASYNTSFALKAGASGTKYRLIFSAVSASYIYVQTQLLIVKDDTENDDDDN